MPVSRTWGLLALARSPAIAMTDLTRRSRQHWRNPTPNEMTSPSEWPAAPTRSGSIIPASGSFPPMASIWVMTNDASPKVCS